FYSTPEASASARRGPVPTRRARSLVGGVRCVPATLPCGYERSRRLPRSRARVVVPAVAGGALAWWAHQPLILGYVFGGLLIGPLTPGVSISDPRTFDLFAEVGVVLLMFSVGIEFSVRDLLRVRRVALLGGPLGMIACAGLGLGVAFVLGWPPLQGVIVGLVTSVARTLVRTRLLLDRGELHSRHGR